MGINSWSPALFRYCTMMQKDGQNALLKQPLTGVMPWTHKHQKMWLSLAHGVILWPIILPIFLHGTLSTTIYLPPGALTGDGGRYSLLYRPVEGYTAQSKFHSIQGCNTYLQEQPLKKDVLIGLLMRLEQTPQTNTNWKLEVTPSARGSQPAAGERKGHRMSKGRLAKLSYLQSAISALLSLLSLPSALTGTNAPTTH